MSKKENCNISKTQQEADKLYSENILLEYEAGQIVSYGTYSWQTTQNNPGIIYLEAVILDKYSQTLNIKILQENGKIYKQLSIDFKITKDGYFANKSGDWKNEYKFLWEKVKANGIRIKDSSPVLLHRFLYALFHKIPNNYDIHHVNFIRNDNRIKNLIPLDKQKHTEIHQNHPMGHFYNKDLGESLLYVKDGIFNLSVLLNNYEEQKHQQQGPKRGESDFVPLNNVLIVDKKAFLSPIQTYLDALYLKNDINAEDLQELRRLAQISLKKLEKEEKYRRCSKNKAADESVNTPLDKVLKYHRKFNLFDLATNTNKTFDKLPDDLSESDSHCCKMLIELFNVILSENNPVILETRIKTYLSIAENYEKRLKSQTG